MSVSAKETRHSIVSVLKDAFESIYFGDDLVDVMNWFEDSYSRSVSVCVKNSRSDISRDRFATPTSLAFGESWTFDIEIRADGLTNNSEISDVIYDIADVIIKTIGESPRLDGSVDGLIRCFVVGEDVIEDDVTSIPFGNVIVNCEYRINRKRTP